MQNDKTEEPAAALSSILHSAFCILHFEVRDTGIGIPPDKQERIFRAFEQEDSSTTRKYGGTGLGLTIASRLVALMGGKISVDSEPRRGSTFTFTVQFGRQSPMGMVEPATSAAIPEPPLLHDLRVLIVDDNATNRHILKEWLRSWQMEPRGAADGPAALDALWHAVRLGQPYPLVLLDTHMPDMDGPTLAARIRSIPELAATRIILLTSGNHPNGLSRIHELRVDARLPKPLQKEELHETICRVMAPADDKRTRWQGDQVTGSDASASVTLSPGHPVTLSSSRPLNILVAEDNELNVQLLELLLVRRGHRVRLASNGAEALTLADEGGFDLLLLDIHMPELDGFGVVRSIRERERSTDQAATGIPSRLPIIALTARSREEDRQRCLAAGMDDFLAKPIHADDLWSAIDRVVLRKEEPQSPSSSEATAEERLVDPQVLLPACGGDDAILGKICQSFRARLPENLAAVGAALEAGDAPGLREAAHKLCGMVSAFSTVAAGVVSDLEDRAALGQLEECRSLVERLSILAEKLIEQVDGLSVAMLRSRSGMAGSPAGQ
jgi:CheY-like chemotaxis protein